MTKTNVNSKCKSLQKATLFRENKRWERHGIQMELLNKSMTNKKERPVKVLQFGEGNFLRGFVDYMIDIANEKGKFDGDIVLVKPIEFGSLDRLHNQECQYTVSLRGIVDGNCSESCCYKCHRCSCSL